MAVSINLLPREKEVDKSTQKVAVVLNKLALGLTVVFLLVVAAGSGVYFLMSRELSGLKEDEARYTNNIQSLQSTEASLILLRDRIQKAESILTSRTAEQVFEKQDDLLSFATGEVRFKRSEVGLGASKLELTSANSGDLLTLVNNLLAQSNFTSLIMEELAFSPNVGYLLVLNIN